MWNFFTHFIAFGFGMTMGVVLMCLLQAGKIADEEMAMLLEKKSRRKKGSKIKTCRVKPLQDWGLPFTYFPIFLTDGIPAVIVQTVF